MARHVHISGREGPVEVASDRGHGLPFVAPDVGFLVIAQTADRSPFPRHPFAFFCSGLPPATTVLTLLEADGESPNSAIND